MLDRVVEIVERRHDLVTEVAQHHLIIECGERFILDYEDAFDDTLSFSEQHPGPTKPYVPTSATNESESCAAATHRKQQ